MAYPAREWAILKLAILAYYVAVYTNIIKNYFDKAYYFDLFAGPGLNKIEELNLILFGSPLIADRVPKKKFDKLYLFEAKSEYAEALRKLLPHAKVKCEDVNGPEFKTIVESLCKDSSVHFLAFVDPEGLEIEWETLQHLFQFTGDIIINCQCTGIARHALKGDKTSARAIERLQRFFGTDEWKSCKDEEELFELYLERIRQYREIVIPIKVTSPYRFYYYIVVAVRKTRGSQKWISVIEDTKEKIEKIKPEELENIVRRLSGGQEKLPLET
ncbi:MAG: three-Cys-motif partner protein TcmP [Nitrososphaerota archaeon]